MASGPCPTEPVLKAQHSPLQDDLPGLEKNLLLESLPRAARVRRPPSLSASGSGVPTVVQERLQRRADGSLLSGAPWASRFPHGHHAGVQWRRKAVRMLSGLRVRGKPPPPLSWSIASVKHPRLLCAPVAFLGHTACRSAHSLEVVSGVTEGAHGLSPQPATPPLSPVPCPAV